MKKLLALVLALALVLTAAAVFVSADEVDEPDGYLVLNFNGEGNAPAVNLKVDAALLGGKSFDVEALVCFGENCVSTNDGSVYLNVYPYSGDKLLNWADYAKHSDSNVELGKWVVVGRQNWDPSKDGMTPDKLDLGVGFWNATGTVKIAYVKILVDGEEVYCKDYSKFTLVDEDIDVIYNMTADNKGTAWDVVVPTVEPGPTGDESGAAPAEPKDVNLAAGKTYTVSGNKPRTDGYADNETGKLTDGLPGGNEASQNYLGFQGVAEEGADQAAVEVVIDLGESKEFKKITADAIYGDWGIAAPAGVKFAVSADGETYGDEIDVATENAEETVGGSDWKLLLYAAEGTFNGRYVKVTYYKANDGQSNHIWTSEIEVIGEEAAAPADPGENSQGGNTPTTGDAGIIALAIVSVIALGGAVIVKKSK